MKQNIVTSALCLLASQYGLTLIGFVFTAYLLRELSKPDFAAIVTLDILAGLFVFSDLGLTGVLDQQAPSGFREDGDRARSFGLIKCMMYTQTVIVLIVGAVAILFSSDISLLFLKTRDYSWVIECFVPAAIGCTWFSFLRHVAQVKGNFFLVARWNFIAGVARQALTIPVYLLLGFRPYVIAIVAATFVPVAGMAYHLRGDLFNRFHCAPILATIRYGLPLYLRSFLRYGFMELDQFVVAVALSPAALASYSATSRLASQIYTITESFQAPIGIRMSSLRFAQIEEKRAFFSSASRYTVVIILPLAAVMAAASPWLMTLYGGAKYADSWPLLVMLVMANAGYALYMVYCSAVFAYQAPKDTLLLDGLVGTANYLSAPLLILAAGQYGIAWGRMLAFGVGILAGKHILKKLPGMKFDKSALRQILFPLAAGLLPVVLGQALYPVAAAVPFYLAAGASLFLLLAMQKVGPDEWRQAREVLPTRMAPLLDRAERLFRDTIPRIRGSFTGSGT
ncbi:MAG: oligosaccharide flippase family protein [Desulfobacteraceae bacterium]|nr:oligosaccharide flippase family protein [Desulfobacteraceae bacterium]